MKRLPLAVRFTIYVVINTIIGIPIAMMYTIEGLSTRVILSALLYVVIMVCENYILDLPKFHTLFRKRRIP